MSRPLRRICAIAKADPRILGLPFSTWSLSKLRDHLLEAEGSGHGQRRDAAAAPARERGVLAGHQDVEGVQRPRLRAKMRRVLDLYDRPPADGRVICVDEFGPLNLQPRPGRAWRPPGQARRLRATFNRTQGVRHMIAGLDLATGKLFYRIRDRKRWREFLSFLKSLRHRWPGQKLYLIVDNFSPHKHPEVTAWADVNAVELVFLPTYASWLNWIEARFRGAALLRSQRHRPPHLTTSRTPRSATTSAGTTAMPDPRPASRSTPRSANLITWSTLRDEALEKTVKTFTPHPGLDEARRLLEARKVCVIGMPGIGKTTLARVLCASYVRAGYDVYDISDDADEVNAAWDDDARQVSCCDDFLGRSTSARCAHDHLSGSRLLLRRSSHFWERADASRVDSRGSAVVAT